MGADSAHQLSLDLGLSAYVRTDVERKRLRFYHIYIAAAVHNQSLATVLYPPPKATCAFSGNIVAHCRDDLVICGRFSRPLPLLAGQCTGGRETCSTSTPLVVAGG